MTARLLSPRRRRLVLILLPLVGLFGVGVGILELPSAPVAPAVIPIPNTTKGRLVEQIETLKYPAPQVGWAVVPTSPFWELVRSIDGGHRWINVTPPGNGTDGGVAVTVTSPETAAVVVLPYQYLRTSTFAITADGGAQWTAGILPNAASKGPDPMYALTSSRLFAVLANGVVLTSSNRGTNWSALTLPALTSGSCLPTSVWFTSPNNGWITGQCQGVAAMWHSADSGTTWDPIALSGAYASSATVSVMPPQSTSSGAILTSAVASGQRGPEALRVFENTSGTWTALPALALPAGRVLVSFANASDGWALDAPHAPGALVLAYRTSDGGINWTVQTTTIPAAEVTAFDLLSSGNAVALTQAGRNEDLWSSSNGGRSWSESKMTVSAGPVPKVNGITGTG
ncbi:MAG: hypothetical protein WBF51_03795 [Candidatus Dormiibacterota bacterium]